MKKYHTSPLIYIFVYFQFCMACFIDQWITFNNLFIAYLSISWLTSPEEDLPRPAKPPPKVEPLSKPALPPAPAPAPAPGMKRRRVCWDELHTPLAPCPCVPTRCAWRIMLMRLDGIQQMTVLSVAQSHHLLWLWITWGQQKNCDMKWGSFCDHVQPKVAGNNFQTNFLLQSDVLRLPEQHLPCEGTNSVISVFINKAKRLKP